MTRAVTYARVSGDDRGKEGRNLKSQLEMCREYAEENDWEIVAELAEDDRGASGADIDLPQLTKIREMAYDGQFDILIVRELDRLSRSLPKQLIIEEELDKQGIRIEYVLGNYEDTLEGKLAKNVRAVISEYERLKISERLARGRYNKVREGKVHLHGNERSPYGYRASDDGTNLVPHEPEAGIVRLMYQWYTVGDEDGDTLSMRGIAKRLTDMRVPTWGDIHGSTNKKAGYGVWRSSTIREYLLSETYAGRWTYGDYEVEVPALVSTEVWEATQRQLEKNRRFCKRSTKYDYLMRQRARHYCGYMMSCVSRRYYTGNLYLYYTCNGFSTLPYQECNRRQFRADHVDAAIWEWLREWLADPDTIRDRLEEYRDEQAKLNKPLLDRIAVTDKLIGEHEEQLSRLLDLYLAGEFPKELLLNRKKDLEQTIKQLQDERANFVDSLEETTLRGKQADTIEQLTREASEGIKSAENDFDKRRKLVDLLDVTVTLTVEDGEKVAYPRFVLSEEATEPLVLCDHPQR